MSSAALTSRAGLLQLLADHDHFILDCDGVLWQGGEILPGAAETLQLLAARGKHVVFVTNNSTRTRAQYLPKLTRLGIDVKESHVYTAAYAATLYLQSQPHVKRVFAVGSQGLYDELTRAGFEVIPGESAPPITGDDDFARLACPQVQAVVCGYDFSLSYAKMAMASLCLQKNPGCLFVGTSRDTYDQLKDRRIPGMTALISGVEASSGMTAHIVGKPAAWLARAILQQHAFQPARTVVVGDRLDSDIQLGVNAGLTTLLVLTGCTSPNDLPNARPKPSHVATHFGALAEAARAAL